MISTTEAQPCEQPEPAPEEREKLSVLLNRLAVEFANRPLSLQELVRVSHGRAYDVVLIFLSLPFFTPVPIPFLSTALGAIIVLIGARLAIGERPWLPKRVLTREIQGKHLVRLLSAASSILRRLEYFLRPRLEFLHTAWVFRRVTGTLIVISGLLLLLPLPIPFSNTLPAATILLLAAGALERDGVFFLAACVVFLATLGFFGAIAFGGAHAFDHAMDWFSQRQAQ